MDSTPPILKHSRAGGFTLLELIAAMVILTIAMSVSFQAFSGTIRAWRRGTEVVDGIKHGDYAMTQLAAALNSAIYFNNARKSYAFLMERDTVQGLPADTLSFVTASSAFMPEYSPLKYGPHRLELFIDYDESGDPALFSVALPAIANMDDSAEEFDTEPYLVSRAVQGIELLLWDEENEDWTDEDWTRANSIPERVKLTVFIASDDEDEEPILFSRVIDIPVAQSLSAKLTSPTSATVKTENEQAL